MPVGICATCHKKRPVIKIINSAESLAIFSCYREDCILEARKTVLFPPKTTKEKKQLNIVEFLVCDTCCHIGTGVVAKAGEGAPCSNCDHNPNKVKTARLPELFF